MLTIFLAFVLIAFVLYVHLLILKPSKSAAYRLPPAPPASLPLLGHLLRLRKDPHKVFAGWSRVLGPLITVHLGSFSVVIINDGELIKKAFKSSALSGRPYLKLFDDLSLNRQGIILSDGPSSHELRLFCVKHLKDFTKDSDTLTWHILVEVRGFLHKLKSLQGRPYQVNGIFQQYIVNTLLSILVGQTFEDDDPRPAEFAELISKVTAIPDFMEFVGIYLPTLTKLFPKFVGYEERLRVAQAMMKFIEPIVAEHRRTLIKGQPRDILHAYLKRMEATTDESSCFHSKTDNIVVSMTEVFVAGMGSTSLQLEWIVYYMAKHPEIQKKAQAEIDRVLRFREPSLGDRGQLPYVEALIFEALRAPTVGPFGIQHRALEDCELEGYFIPKDTIVMNNIYGAHHDPEIWDGDPETFRPERFLTECEGEDDRRRVISRGGFVPFSSGKRACLCETLVRNQLFLFTTALLQRFSMTAASDLSGKLTFRMAISPAPFKAQYCP